MEQARALWAVVAVESDLDERFSAFVGTHRERARRLAYRLVGGDEAAADDVAQEAFVRAYAALDRFREDAMLSTWFYRILVRQAQSYRRWRAVRDAWTGLWSGEARDPAPVPAGDPGLRRRIGTALAALTRSQREPFILVHLEGFTVREAAAVLRKPEGTVKSHLHRALRALRTELADLRELVVDERVASSAAPADPGSPMPRRGRRR
jgi:RNA polymerase sigma-70 factor, ECF subfamily